MPHLIEDDQSSDALDTYEDEHYDDLPRGIQQVDLNNKTISIAPGQDKSGDEVVTGNRSSSISNDADTNADAASARSVPALTVSQASPQPSEMHPGRVESPPGTISPVPPPSPSRSHHSTRPSVASAESRRRRSNTLENNRPNRLSGFFNNFIHRRDHGSPDLPIREEAADKDKAETYSRPETPPPRPGTPPPELAPPSLKELGLSLNVLTSNLSPAHFTTPPTSGAFLAPHYLLLCHAQGLDVLPLVSPPAAQPYALVRRVCFKSVVVMEQRGVLVAIAGRRDGVRVYALEEVKRAVEWRIDVEVRREREKQRREGTRRLPSLGSSRSNVEKPPVEQHAKSPSQSSFPPETSSPTTMPPMIPRTPTVRRAKSRPSMPPVPVPPPTGQPPPYSAEDDGRSYPAPPTLVPPSMRTRGLSVSEVLTGPSRHYASNFSDPDAKAEPLESSDDEAINIVAAGASGSEALDERTSSTSPASSPVGRRTSHSISRTNRPANLDLSLSRTDAIPQPEPSPAPTLLTLRQALSHSPSRERPDPSDLDLTTPDMDVDNDFDDEQETPGISLSQMLRESRLPNLPPPGTRQTQQPIIIAGGTVNQEEVASPRSSDVTSTYYTDSETLTASANRRRRWSNIIGQGSATNVSTPAPVTPSAPPSSATQVRNVLQRSSSFRSRDRSASAGHLQRPSTAPGNNRSEPQALPPVPGPAPSIVSATSSRSSRFIPRLLTAFQNRRSEDRAAPPARNAEADSSRRTLSSPLAAQTPPPKLEYVKLPGTKGALLVKAVETAKKSFLAILCGDNGEKVELFAGTYRTALGLSRTFILPDSPRSLELQLQGDDLVEVFLVFSQNVFGLEPATVRVREVRIGRAERRAARRRAREARAAEGGEAVEDEPSNASVSIGVSVSVGSTVVATGTGPDGTQTPPLIAAEHPNQPSESTTLDSSSLNRPATPGDPTTTTVHPEDIAALSGSHMGPYTTFQQLTFAPQFPLASIADDYVIPPTYPDFIDYRNEHEPDNTGSDLAQVQFSPPGLPVPVPSAPSKWFYKDPKSVVHGPWKAALMQAWYKDGLLPPDLPVRREEDDEFTLLKDLRLQSVDPAHPFRASAANTQLEPPSIFQPSDKPFLKPISLLAQPRHFGPPALFFSSRGGHSTTIVDNRGRSVLKGRFMWTKDEEDTKAPSFGRMGDVKRLEAFDIRDRAVLVAMRQGGLEVVDLSDALLKPADESRTALPQFNPPASSYNRRGPYVWKMGMPISGGSTLPPSKGKSSLSPLPSKRTNVGASRSPSGKTEFGAGSSEGEMQDEVLFLGRKADQLFICERNAGSFRILRLSPS